MTEPLSLSDGIDVRPRTAGEILDDACRVYLAHAPTLLAMSSLFVAPVAIVLFLLLTEPVAGSLIFQWLLPTLAAIALPMIGLGSAACQEAFRRLSEGKRLELSVCLLTALRRGLPQTAARALVLAVAAPGLVGLGATVLAVSKDELAFHHLLAFLGELFWVALVFWMASEWAPFLAGEGSLLNLGQIMGRTVQVHPGKAALMVLTRFVLLTMLVLNLHLVMELVLWLAESFVGLEGALVNVMVSLSNPPYLLALVLLGWILMAPFNEAVSYLLHADLRARYEGLDLWYRVQRHFPLSQRQRIGAALLAAVAALLFVAPAHAADDRLAAVQQTRKEIQQISEEVKTTDPYPGGKPWMQRLKGTAQRLHQAGEGQAKRHRWLDQAIEDFADRKRDDALIVLADLDRRLALLEESMTPSPEPASGELGTRRLSREELRKLLPSSSGETDDPVPEKKARAEAKQDRIVRDDGEGGRGGPRGQGLVGPQASGGLETLGWMCLVGLLIAVVAVTAVLAWRWRKQAPREPKATSGEIAPSLESLLAEMNAPATVLWRKAEELARAGQFLEAVRILYLAVLSLLHRAHYIRYERTHTNGEYEHQLHLSADAPTFLHSPFHRLIRLFEEKWYGQRSCDPEDYQSCRTLAEEIRDGMQS